LAGIIASEKGFHLSDELVYALGVYFSYDEELATKRNFFAKLPKLKKILNIWSSRDISIYGKYIQNFGNIQTNFYLQRVTHSKEFTDEVNNIIFDYIWKYKDLKLKKTTPVKSKKEG